MNTIVSYRNVSLIGLAISTVFASGIFARVEAQTQPVLVNAREAVKSGRVTITPPNSAAALNGSTSPTTTTFKIADTTIATPATSKKRVVAQSPISIGRPTVSGASYIGVGGNLGITGGSALSDTNFAVISKIGLTRNISVRPGAIIGDNPVVLLPVTVDFPVRSVPGASQISYAPYIGGGAAITTGDSSDVGGLITAGVDVPLTPQFTANASANLAFLNDTDFGLVLGVGYNFNGF
jgi:hypothetical protein